MKLGIITNIENYDSLNYFSGPVKAQSFIDGKYNKIHDLLYNEALQEFLKEYPEYNDKHLYNIIEIKHFEYWIPSNIYICTKQYPFTKEEYSLAPFWNKLYVNGPDYSKQANMIVSEENINDAEIVYYDYVRGTVKMLSRLNDIEFEMPFEYISPETYVSNDMIINPLENKLR